MFYITLSNGLLTNNATWFQNRGCICISSTRRTYGRIHSSFLHTSSHPDKYNNSVNRIISKEEEREDPRRDSSIYLRVQCFHTQSIHYKNYSVSTRNPASFQSSHAILHTELILPQEISKKYYKAHPVHTNRRHPPATVPHASKHSTWQNPAIRPLQHKQASSNSTRQKQHSKQQPASTQPLQQVPRENPLSTTRIHLVLQNSTRRNRIHFKRVKYCMSMQY